MRSRITRRLGLTVSIAGGPLTAAGQARVDDWRRLWHRYGAPPLPLLVTDLGAYRSGEDALRWLAHRLAHGDPAAYGVGRVSTGVGMAVRPQPVAASRAFTSAPD